MYIKFIETTKCHGFKRAQVQASIAVRREKFPLL